MFQRLFLPPLPRRALLGSAVAGLFALAARAEEPVVVGVSGPLTGQYAQYGADWRRGFDLAVDEVNNGGGINGRPLSYRFEDTQSDPRQAVAVAQKFAADPAVVAELGDFSSAASMAASPIYQRAKLVQFGFTNSHPDFTRGGDHMWSNAPNQADDMPVLAEYAAKLGLRKPAIAFINSDWGRTSKDLFAAAAQKTGLTVAAAEAYLPNEQDFRSLLVRLRDASPDGLVLVSYYPDGALIMRQARDAGLQQPVVAAGSVYSPKFLELAGGAAEGVYTNTNFFPADPRPVVQRFVAAYRAKEGGSTPGFYAARGYDAMMLLAAAMRQGGATRAGVQDGLAAVRDVPSVLFGTVTFDPDTRRVRHPASIDLVVRDGAFALWDGKPAVAAG